MIQFNFALSARDAENLVDILRHERARAMGEAAENKSQGNVATSEWFAKYAAYVDSIRQKIVDGQRPQ